MLFALSLWPLLAIGVGILAGAWDRSGFLWFITAIVISPLISVLLLLILGKPEKSGGRPDLRCPECNYINDADAQYCANCGAQFQHSAS